MLKFALIKNNIVENIISCENSSFVENISGHYDSVQFIGTNSDSKLIDIGSLWDSVGEIKKNPEKTKKVEKMERMRKDWDLISDQIEMLKQKPEEQLTEEERKILEENDRNNSIMEKVFYYG